MIVILEIKKTDCSCNEEQSEFFSTDSLSMKWKAGKPHIQSHRQQQFFVLSILPGFFPLQFLEKKR